MNKGRFYFFILTLQLVSLVSSATRPFLPHHPAPQDLASSPYPTEPNKGMSEEAYYRRGVTKIGSSPPICEHKCNGCSPCEAIQVPSTSRHSHLRTQYTNYEPESWKCKCGPSFYSP